MKLTAKSIQRFQQAEKQFDKIVERFDAFVQRLEYFDETDCPIKGIVISGTSSGKGVVVRYRTVEISLRLILQLDHQGSTSARVVCKLADAIEERDRTLLGQFNLDRNGTTDLEDPVDGDPVDIEGMAPEIILHYLYGALSRGAA